MSRRGIAVIVIFGVAVSTAISIYAFRGSLNPEPPLAEIEQARKMLSESKKSKCQTYSKKLYKEAEKLYDSAMTSWKVENEKLPFNRNYAAVRKLASESVFSATRAIEDSRRSQANIKVNVGNKVDSLQHVWNNFREIFISLPLPGNIRKEYTHGMMLLSEAEKACQSKRYSTADEKILLAEKSLEKSFRYADNLLSGYFRNYPKWTEWAEQTVNNSRKSSAYAIIVDKFSRECLLYHKGVLKNTFKIDLGTNWIGDKQHKGDKSTPEGYYKVLSKKEGKRTRYHKALLIDYPNKEDKERFKQNKKNGTVGKSADPGGSIEIHGEGGKGADWTEGCIALKNSDMDVLFRYVSVGTPVTIVGSLKPLETFLK